MKAWLGALMVVVVATAALGADGKKLRFTRAAEMPDSGIRLLLPSAAEADPTPPPPVMSGFREMNGVRERIEVQTPLEVWRWRQREGRWVDGDGNRFILAAATLSVPETMPELLPPAETARFLSGLSASGRTWQPADVARWLELFWGQKDVKAEPLQRGKPFGLEDALLITGPAGQKVLGAAFRLKSGPETWRFALLELDPRTDAASAAKALQEDFLPSIQFLGKRTTVRASPAQGGPSGSGVPTAREASARRARESIRNMKGWWYEESKSIIVLSNIRSGKSQLVNAILEDLESIRPSWEALVPPWDANREVAVIRVFGTAEEYIRYVGQDHAWTAGVFMPMHRELVIRPMDEGSVMKNRRAVLGIVYHEAFHQYLDAAFQRAQAAPWFNEGYAALFASIALSNRGVKFDKDPDSVPILSQLAREGRADPARILSLDYPGFYSPNEKERRENYALAWGLMYFLHGDPGNKKAIPYAAIPAKYATALKESRQMAESTTKAFEGVDMAEFTKAFQAYWR